MNFSLKDVNARKKDDAIELKEAAKIVAENKDAKPQPLKDMVHSPSHYADKGIEVIDYIRDTLTKEEMTGYCCGNVLKYVSRWRKKDGIQDLKKAYVYLGWMIESAEKEEAEKSV